MRWTRTSVTLGLAIVACASGCRRGSPAREPPGRAPDGDDGFEVPTTPLEAGDFVRIREGTRLYQRPGAEAPSVVAKFADGQSRAAEVAEVRGEWIGVWLGPPEEQDDRCVRPLSDEPLDVQLWVRAGELPVVTILRTDVQFDDMTSVTLMQGVIVRPTGERDARGRLFEIDAEGIALTLPLPEDRLGRSYSPTRGVTPIEIVAGPRPRVTVGDQTVEGEVSVALAPMAPTSRGRLAEVRSSCLDMIAWATEETVAPRPAARRRHNPAFARGDRPEERQLGENVELRWFDGSRAGVTTGPVQADGGRFGERFCFDVLDGDTDPPLVLCAPVAEPPSG